jgi:hypothetical protein
MDTRPPNKIAERGPVDGETFLREVVAGFQPVILRGQVADWPAVAAAKAGTREIADYVARFEGGAPLEVFVGAPEIGGRFFYTDDLSGFNFVRQKASLRQLMGELLRLAEARDPAPHALYASAVPAPAHSPGWTDANRLGLPIDATARLWIGNATTVATHYDTSPNIACVVAGRRRFTLFPPDQLANLYIGPLDHTIAGPPVSMVDPYAPDLDRYPRFADAWANARFAELEPGDAIFIPSLWWHHVQALDPLNVLVNYWWAERAGSAAFVALVHAMLAVRDLPDAERATWRGWFDHLVFDDAAPKAGDHLPAHARTVLDGPGVERGDRIRRFLIGALRQSD